LWERSPDRDRYNVAAFDRGEMQAFPPRICDDRRSAIVALTALERRRCERDLDAFLERKRPAPHIRHQLDISYRIAGQSVELFEIRPDWQDATRKIETPVARATFVRNRNVWRVFWMRRDLKWHGYQPNPQVVSLEAFLNVVDRDEHGCFFG
jgi:hypothetical protein